MFIMKKEYVISSDLAQVAAISLEFPIEKVDKTNPKKVVFFFKKTRKLDSYLEKYWDDTLKISPQSYFAQIKAIKNRIYGNS